MAIMNETYLDLNGLLHFVDKINEKYSTKEENDKLIQIKTMAEWAEIDGLTLSAGTLIVYSDRTNVNGVYVPDIKIADGYTTIANLPFLSNRDITRYFADKGITFSDNEITASHFKGSASKVDHTLTIGNYTYNGSADVSVPIYDGE